MALDIRTEFDDRHGRAITYHQLGMVAQEQRQWGQAEAHYRKALDNYVELEDRYERAGTIHQIGRLAEEQGQAPNALQAYLESLTIFGESEDYPSRSICLRSLARLDAAHSDLDVPAKVAETLGATRDEAAILLRQLREYDHDG